MGAWAGVWTGACLVLGPCFGSLAGVLAVRLPAGRAVGAARSRCDGCGRVLPARDLVPLVSFVLLGGRCRWCGGRIGPFAPGMELAGLGVAASAWWVEAWWLGADDPAWLVASCVLGWGLLPLAVIDARELWLPDVLTMPLLGAGLVATWWLDPGAVADHALGAGVGFLAFRAVSLAYRLLRGRDGLGEGDATLLAALGAWGGTASLGPTVFGAAALGLGLAGAVAARRVLAGRGVAGLGAVRFPFGTLLAVAFWVVWLWAAWPGTAWVG